MSSRKKRKHKSKRQNSSAAYSSTPSQYSAPEPSSLRPPQVSTDLVDPDKDSTPSSGLQELPQLSSLGRRLAISALGLFLGIQTWAALSYYQSDYPWDERFAWRMFSPVRGLKCSYQIWERQDQSSSACPDKSGLQCAPYKLSRHHHMVWNNLLKRGRLSVLSQLARYECQKQVERSPSINQPGFFVDLRCPDPIPGRPIVQVHTPQLNLCKATHPTQPHLHAKETK